MCWLIIKSSSAGHQNSRIVNINNNRIGLDLHDNKLNQAWCSSCHIFVQWIYHTVNVLFAQNTIVTTFKQPLSRPIHIVHQSPLHLVFGSFIFNDTRLVCACSVCVSASAVNWIFLQCWWFKNKTTENKDDGKIEKREKITTRRENRKRNVHKSGWKSNGCFWPATLIDDHINITQWWFQ